MGGKKGSVPPPWSPKAKRTARAQELALRGLRLQSPGDAWNAANAEVESIRSLVGLYPITDQAGIATRSTILNFAIVKMVAGFESFYRSLYQYIIDNRPQARENLYRLEDKSV